MAQAARRAGVKTMVAFNNIKTPAALLAKQIIARGDIGEPVRFRGTFDQGFYNDPNLADMIWSCSLFLLLLILVMNIIAKNVARKWKI